MMSNPFSAEPQSQFDHHEVFPSAQCQNKHQTLPNTVTPTHRYGYYKFSQYVHTHMHDKDL
eukprot:m.382197 g.382197  ORF g.382197 m.382197 type:complete len:61 (+) comp114881_c0_seq1:64-246(+)